MKEKPIRVLFLCTGNSCRSILAEAQLNRLGKGRFAAFSAGSQPVGYVHAGALNCLRANNVPITDPSSKSWDAFIHEPLDLVITVCGNAAAESCPIFPGEPLKAHWGLPDPAHAKGTESEIAAVFQTVFDSLTAHIGLFVAACSTHERLDREVLTKVLNNIGAPNYPDINS